MLRFVRAAIGLAGLLVGASLAACGQEAADSGDQMKRLLHAADEAAERGDVLPFPQLLKDLDGLWAKGRRESYEDAVVHVCERLRHMYCDNERRYDLLCAAASQVIAKKDGVSYEVQIRLLKELTSEKGYLREMPAEAWAVYRRKVAGLLLDLWGTLRAAVNPDVDLSHPPPLNPPCPDPSLPSGMEPAAVKDPQLRKIYENWIARHTAEVIRFNRELDVRSALKDCSELGERYLVYAYGRPPADLVELRSLMDRTKLDAETQGRILRSITEK